MKITVSTTELKSALGVVAPAIAKRNIIPILECILVEAQDGKVKITATDMENTVIVPVEAVTSQSSDFAIALPYELLTKVAASLPAHEPVSLEFDAGFACNVTQGNTSAYKFNGQDPAEYPKTDIDAVEFSASIPFGKLRSSYKEAIGFVCSPTEFRPAMSGVFTTLSANASEVVATNGHWLYQNEIGVIGCDSPFSFILSSKAAQLICKQEFSPDADVQVNMLESGKCLFDFINADGITSSTVICQPIDAQYVHYKSVIPNLAQAHTCIAIENNSALKDMLKRLIVTAEQAQFDIYVSYNPEQGCTFSSNSTERGTSGIERVHIEDDPNGNRMPFEASLNGKLFLGCIEVFADADEFQAYYFGQGKAVLIKDRKDGEVTVLLMPLMTNKNS